jgi:hypothetical protein
MADALKSVLLGCIRRAHWAIYALCGSYISAAACSAADIRTWAFEATIVQINDPQMLFGDVRLGDPVRGTFSYDVSIPMDATSNPPEWADYTHPGWFQGLRMAIQNPRTGEELRYGKEPDDYREWFVDVYTEAYFYSQRPSVVGFWSWTELPPRPDLLNLVYIEFDGQNVLNDTALPTSYNLDDWPDAAIYLDAAPGKTGEAIAQFHTITPLMPGDFTLDRKVDVDDYSLWRSTFGPTGVSEADWNRDGSVDAADYVVWRKNAGMASVSNLVATVPEPASAPLELVLISFAIAARGFRPRRR